MNKRIKIGLIGSISAALLVYWLVLYLTQSKATTANYWWQAGLALLSIVAGILGVITAKNWSWLKSGVGKGVFFISLGLIMWGLGQAGWAYYTIAYPGQEVVYNKLVDVLYFLSIPLWFYGIWCLSKATGAKYGLRSVSSKVLVVLTSLIMIAASYYFLIIVARGGSSYFEGQTVWNAFFDLAYAFGDAINLILATVIFGLSWRFLGGRFRKPIIAILLAFALLYVADFWFSYSDGKGQYYNGHLCDLLYLGVVATLGIALYMLDPSSKATLLTKMFTKSNANAKVYADLPPEAQNADPSTQEMRTDTPSVDINQTIQDQSGGVATSQINNQQGGQQ